MSATNASPVMTGNVMSALGGAAARLGLAGSGVRSNVEDTVAAVLAERGITASVYQMRYGVLHLETDARTAALLRYDTDVVLQALADRVPGAVNRVVVRVRRAA